MVNNKDPLPDLNAAIRQSDSLREQALERESEVPSSKMVLVLRNESNKSSKTDHS